MDSDCSLYVEVDHVLRLRALLGGDFDAIELAEGCAFGRVASEGVTESALVEIAERVSADRRAIVMSHIGYKVFFFVLFDRGVAIRTLALTENGWQVVDGPPQPWEVRLKYKPTADEDGLDFEVFEACDIATEHYKLTPSPDDHARREMAVDFERRLANLRSP